LRFVMFGLVALAGLVASIGATHDASAAQQTTSPEMQLAEQYSPIVMLKRQEHECDRSGEAYLPAPVEVVFDDPQVALRRASGRSRSDNETIKMAPNESDLAGNDDSYFLDFPGNPRKPGCGYERWFRQRMAGHEPVTYANVVSLDGHVFVQYWFWYVFNDFKKSLSEVRSGIAACQSIRK
jgi:hypothetical protein